jgi:hypothetical protein
MTIGVYIRVSSPKGQKTTANGPSWRPGFKRQRLKGARWFEDRESAATLRRRFPEIGGLDLRRPDRYRCGVEARPSRAQPQGKHQRFSRLVSAWRAGHRHHPTDRPQWPLGNLIASFLFGIAEIELQHSKERQAIGIALAKKGPSTLDACRAQQRLHQHGHGP